MTFLVTLFHFLIDAGPVNLFRVEADNANF